MNERREAGGGGAVPEASVHLTPGAGSGAGRLAPQTCTLGFTWGRSGWHSPSLVQRCDTPPYATPSGPVCQGREPSLWLPPDVTH